MRRKILVWFLFTVPFCVNNLYLPTAKLELEKVEEVQNALCSITTKEIEATANATITRELKGVCTSSELNLKMDNLQTKILQEIDGIKYILELNGFKVPENDNPTSESTDSNDTNYKTGIVDLVGTTLAFKTGNNLALRSEETLMYNNTTVDSSEGKKYFYYWKIENIHELLVKSNMYKSSPDFIVLGHVLHLYFYPNHPDKKHFSILLKPNSSGFIKKHRVIILNQLDPTMDIISGILYGMKSEERMLEISEEKLRFEGFIFRNSLIIRLEIFLNS